MLSLGTEVVAWVASHPLGLQCLEADAIGVLAHLLYFIHWKVDLEALKVAIGHILAFLALLFVQISARGAAGGILAACAVFSSYLTALFTSIAIYRVFFHRLRRFPGPFMARFSKLYGIYLQRNNKRPQEYDALTKKYGDFVRIGPNEILHTSIDCMTRVHGPQAKCFKGSQYIILEYGPGRIHNLDAISDKTVHRYRRQVWDKAFNGKSLDAREAPIRATVLEWLSKVDALQGKPVDWTLFSSLISFDIMGKTGFSVDFGGLKSGEKSILQRYIQALFKNVATTGQFPWLISLFQRSKLPLSRDVAEHEKLARALVDQRLQDTEDKEDIIKHFIDDFRSEKPKSFFTKYHLECDAQAILIGAADSSFSPITFCIRHLVLRPDIVTKLREELEPIFNTSQPQGFAHLDLAHAELLNAVLDETMRLHNPTGTNGARHTPPEGVILDGTFIPGNVSLLSSIWSFHRSEKYFVRPLEWIPERWTTQTELVLDKRAFHPFSFGPFNCVGKRMAMMTLRMVVAYTLWFCDIEFAPGEDGTNVVELSRDELFLVPGPLHLTFKKRLPHAVEG